MRRHHARVGRPSKGDRQLFQLSMLPSEQTDEVLRRAAELGLSQSDYLAVVIARAHDVAADWPPANMRLFATARTHVDHPRLQTRVPRAAADVVMEAAETREMPYSRYVAAVVARAHGFPAELPLPRPATRSEESLISA